jgi:hypothetical protein
MELSDIYHHIVQDTRQPYLEWVASVDQVSQQALTAGFVPWLGHIPVGLF